MHILWWALAAGPSLAPRLELMTGPHFFWGKAASEVKTEKMKMRSEKGKSSRIVGEGEKETGKGTGSGGFQEREKGKGGEGERKMKFLPLQVLAGPPLALFL